MKSTCLERRMSDLCDGKTQKVRPKYSKARNDRNASVYLQSLTLFAFRAIDS